jgi:EAL domain-containing protein (putative c-di-GMP-specific phosphodiesterase class I)
MARRLTRAFASALDSLWLAYQPIISVAQRRPCAYEALARTQTCGLMRPASLIKAAEELERLHDLGRRCRSHVAARARERPDLDFFVNVHPNDLLDEQLFDSQAPLSTVAKQIVLEVTERAALDGLGDVGSRVRRLRRMGFRIALDDLGAGYAGLNSFVELQPDVVKLDMVLIRDIDRHKHKQELISRVVSLCHDLGAIVVAEGVETQGERDALVAMNCDLLQGYLFGRPARRLRCGPRFSGPPSTGRLRARADGARSSKAEGASSIGPPRGQARPYREPPSPT